MVRIGDTDTLLHSFQICELDDEEFGTARIAVLAFDTEQNGHSYDLLIKDLEQDMLLPVLILNTDGDVAFDKLAGFYYTQVDGVGRGAQVFRHQVGTQHNQDVLIYDESSNPDYSVSVETSLSRELILLKVRTTFEPYSNEIWIRNTNYDLD